MRVNHVDRGGFSGLSYVRDLLAVGRPGWRGIIPIFKRTFREASLLEAVHIDLENGSVTFASGMIARAVSRESYLGAVWRPGGVFRLLKIAGCE